MRGHRVAIQGNAAAVKRAEKEKKEQEAALKAAAEADAAKKKPPPVPKLDPETMDWSDGEEPDENYWLLKKGKYLSEKDRKTAEVVARNLKFGNGEEQLTTEELRKQFQDQALLNPNQPAVVTPFTHKEDYKRSKINIAGDTKDKLTRSVKGVLPREERKPKYASYRFPLPHLPAHVKLSLGPDIIEHLWHEFIMHGADASELVKLTKLKKIAVKMEHHMGYKLYEFDSLSFPGLEKNDYVEFSAVCGQLAIIAEKRNTRVQKINSASMDAKHPLMRLPLPACCAMESCQRPPDSGGKPATDIDENGTPRNHKDKTSEKLDGAKAGQGRDGGNGKDSTKTKSKTAEKDAKEEEDDDDDDEVNVDLHALKVSYVTFKLRQHGNLRLRHVPTVLEMAGIPFDKSRYPSVEWDLRGEMLVTTMDQCLLIANMIRTDLDAHVSEEADPKYQLPRWMENEFKRSEIMLFKHHFKSIDADGGGVLEAVELQALTESLGSKVTIEEANHMVAIMDLDGGGTVSFDEFMMLMYKIQNGVIDLGDNMLAKSIMAAKSQIFIFEEIEENMHNSVPNTKIEHYGGSPVSCDVRISGPIGSAYEGGNFIVRVTFVDGYPYKKPEIVFLTRIFHVNIVLQFDGQGYMPHIDALWDNSWTLRRLIEHIQELLANAQADVIPVDMVHIVKVFLSEKLAAAQEFERQRRQAIAEAKAERLAYEAELAAEAAEAAEFLLQEQAQSKVETRTMSGEDPLYNELECQGMSAYDRNMAAVLSLDEEEELVRFLEGYRTHYAELKAEAEEEAHVEAEEKAAEDEEERIRLEAEEKAAIDAGQDPTLALLEGLIGGGEEAEDLSYVNPKYRKVVKHKTSDELMAPMSRQQQMHLSTIQMFLFENKRYNQAVVGYVEKFAKVFAADVAFEDDDQEQHVVGVVEDHGAGAASHTHALHARSATSSLAGSGSVDGGQHEHEHEHEHEHDYDEGEIDAEADASLEGGGPSKYYRDGRRKKNPEVDDESSEESEGEGNVVSFD